MYEFLKFLFVSRSRWKQYQEQVNLQAASLREKHGMEVAVEYRKKMPQTWMEFVRVVATWKNYSPAPAPFSLHYWRQKTMESLGK